METGACPHTAIRDDVPTNLLAVEDLEADFAPLDLVLVESGGDNLTATFSPALVDAQIFVLDVAGGGDVARDGAPVLALSRKVPATVDQLADWVRRMVNYHLSGEHVPQDPGPMAPYFHADEDGGYEHTHDGESGAAAHAH